MRLKHLVRGAAALLALALSASWATPAQAQTQKPNIVVIMGDDIGIWNIGAYHRGMMAGRTPNIDKIAPEGMLFTDYYAEASCTAGRAEPLSREGRRPPRRTAPCPARRRPARRPACPRRR